MWIWIDGDEPSLGQGTSSHTSFVCRIASERERGQGERARREDRRRAKHDIMSLEEVLHR